MIQILILMLLSHLCIIDGPKDGGNCVRYNVNITLDSDQSLEGIVVHGTYHPKFDFQNLEFKQFLDSIAIRDTITVYKQIHEFTTPNNYYGYGIGCKPNLYAVAPEDVVKVPINEVADADLQSYEPCHNCTSNNKQSGYTFDGLTMIRELTKAEIEILQEEAVASHQFWYPDSLEEFGYGSYQILSYNENIGLDELKKFGEQLIQEDIEDLKQGAYNSYHSRKSRYQQYKEELRNKDVVLFTIHEMP